MSIKKKTLGLAAVGVLMFAGTAFADDVNLRDIMTENADGTWSIPGQTDGSHVEWVQNSSATLTGRNIILDNANVTVTIGPYDARTTMVQAGSFNLKNGALNVTGGTSGSVSSGPYYGLNLGNGAFTQSGGTSTLTGGTDSNTIGLGAGSVAMTGGTMYATGGDGANANLAHGLSTTTFTVSGDSTVYATGGASEMGSPTAFIPAATSRLIRAVYLLQAKVPWIAAMLLRTSLPAFTSAAILPRSAATWKPMAAKSAWPTAWK